MLRLAALGVKTGGGIFKMPQLCDHRKLSDNQNVKFACLLHYLSAMFSLFAFSISHVITFRYTVFFPRNKSYKRRVLGLLPFYIGLLLKTMAFRCNICIS